MWILRLSPVFNLLQWPSLKEYISLVPLLLLDGKERMFQGPCLDFIFYRELP